MYRSNCSTGRLPRGGDGEAEPATLPSVLSTRRRPVRLDDTPHDRERQPGSTNAFAPINRSSHQPSISPRVRRDLRTSNDRLMYKPCSQPTCQDDSRRQPAEDMRTPDASEVTSGERATGLEVATSSLGSERPQRGPAPTSVNWEC
jgi:hypothetical protein